MQQCNTQNVPSTDNSCSCNSENNKNSNAIPFDRLTLALKKVEKMLASKIKHSKRLLEDCQVHTFDDGFGVGSWALTKNQLTYAAAGVVDCIPSEATLIFDTSFFDQAKDGNEKDVMWVELEISSPTKEIFKIPLRGVGVLRHPKTGNLLRCEKFELATDLIADLGDIAKVIGCILACVGLFCGIACAPLCIAIVACLACLAACIGAQTAQFLTCVTACGVAVDSLT